MSLMANCSSGHALINSCLSGLSCAAFEGYAVALPALGAVKGAAKGSAVLPLLVYLSVWSLCHFC